MKFGVIGLGNFGSTVAKALFEAGHDVVVLDRDRDRVQAMQRYATQAVIADARLLDRSGAPCGAFAPGSRARFQFTVHFRKDARDVSFGCTVRSQDQTVVMDTSSFRLNHDGFNVRKGTAFRVAFHLRLNLAPGTYVVDANVFDFVRRRVLDIQDGLATFVVHADERASGSAYMDPACEVDVLEAGST